MKEKLIERYKKGWVTRAQLERYKALGAITEEELREILDDKEAGGSF